MPLFNLIFLLCTVFASTALSASNKEKKETPKETVKIVCLGDSITEGYGVTKDEAFPSLMTKEFAKAGRVVEVVNAGISGSTSASGMSRLRWIIKSKPSMMLIELGANDGLRGQDVAATKKNLKEMIQTLKKEKIKPILVGMNLPPNFGKDYRKKFAETFEDVAKEEQVPLVPFFDQFFEKKGLLQKDGLHPNAQGHQLIAHELTKILMRYL